MVVALRAEDMDWVEGVAVAGETFAKPVRLVEGGETRQESVENALAAGADVDTDLVAVHDAVRPFVRPRTITR
jgi:2-C-methyl-D-erythritol 4-phosphate cytidylyltransferase